MPPSDLVIRYPDANIIRIIELTVGLPCETNIEEEHTLKTNKYATIIQDIKDNQTSSELMCGSRLQRLCIRI